MSREDRGVSEGVELENYNGTWSLVQARQSNEGKVYKDWAYPQARTEKGEPNRPIEKCLPWKITLADTAKGAIEMLHAIAQALGEESGVPAGDDDGDSIPF